MKTITTAKRGITENALPPVNEATFVIEKPPRKKLCAAALLYLLYGENEFCACPYSVRIAVSGLRRMARSAG